MLQVLARNQPSEVKFKLPLQGRDVNFVRQGSPGKLRVISLGKEIFSIIVWAVIIAAGIAMLKLDGMRRLMILLAAALVGGLIHLFLPLLICRAAYAGTFATVLVFVLWAGQWIFLRLPAIRAVLPAKVKAGRKTAETNSDKNEQKKQSKKNEE
jgi:hypothetical protein